MLLNGFQIIVKFNFCIVLNRKTGGRWRIRAMYPVNSKIRKYTDGRIIEFISKNVNENDVHVRLFFVDLKEIAQRMQTDRKSVV